MRVRVVGCGNPDAGDDALGLVAVERARPRLETLPGVEVVLAGLALRVVDLLEDVEAVVVVDAVREPTGARPPGTLVRVRAGRDGLPAEVGASLSSHGIGLSEAVGLAAALGPSPDVLFLGLEAEDVTIGHPFSAAVEAALPALAALVVTEVERLSRAPSSP